MRYTLWQLLQRRGVEIPVFQRDYAQGRPDKATLRRDFLHQLVFSLNGDKDSDGSLDFVYSFGNCTEEAAPLDGQQRLTTLWLLHWYLAVKVLKKKELQEKLEILSKFTYRTRHSSSDFISSLCQVNNISDLNRAINITDAICNSTWFVKSWLNDPTVMGMLTTLKGSDTTELSSLDGIQPILGKYSHKDLENFWTLLISDSCPIIFDHLNIDSIEVKSPDLLYVKMNARGKSLSAYEKFKAQWIKTIKNIDNNKAFEISRMIDNEWSDIFWDRELKVKGIDQRKMAFFTRFYLYRLMLSFVTDDSLKNLVLEKQEKILGASSLYTKETMKDWYKFEFIGMEEFDIPSFDSSERKSLVSQTSNNELEIIFNRLKLFKSIDDFLPIYMSGFSFIPSLRTKRDGLNEMDNDGNWQVDKISMKQQALFFAVCLYLVKSKSPSESGLKRWLRVCSNFIENTNPNSNRQTQLNIVKWIYKLGTCELTSLDNEVNQNQTMGCDSILECLNKFEFNKSNELENVLWEEQQKAVRIISNGNSEIEIEEAEKFAFFNGAIRFLFLNAYGEVDWTNFNRKFSTAKQLFCAEGLTDDARVDDLANRKLISHCDDWVKQIEWHYYILSHKADEWRKILLSFDFCGPVHKLLTTNLFADVMCLKETDLWRKISHELLVNGTYLKYYNQDRVNDYYIRWMGGILPDNGMCLYLKGRPAESFFLASTWLIELYNCPDFKIVKPNDDFIYSRRSSFDIVYHGHTFRFQTWGWIDMYVDGKKLEDIDALKGKCVLQTPWIDPKHPNVGIDTLKSEFNRCIANYELWKST